MYGHEIKYEMHTAGEHAGRCCPVNDIDKKPSKAIEENSYWVSTNYDRFKGGRLSSVEVHGGATLEELLVPVIVFSLNENDVINAEGNTKNGVVGRITKDGIILENTKNSFIWGITKDGVIWRNIKSGVIGEITKGGVIFDSNGGVIFDNNIKGSVFGNNINCGGVFGSNIKGSCTFGRLRTAEEVL